MRFGNWSATKPSAASPPTVAVNTDESWTVMVGADDTKADTQRTCVCVFMNSGQNSSDATRASNRASEHTWIELGAVVAFDEDVELRAPLLRVDGRQRVSALPVGDHDAVVDDLLSFVSDRQAEALGYTDRSTGRFDASARRKR